MSTPNPNRKIYKPSLVINYKILIQKDGKVTLGSLRCTRQDKGIWKTWGVSVVWVHLFWDMVQKLLMWSRSFPLHLLIQDTLQWVLILFIAAQPVWNATVCFAWVCVTGKLKLSLRMSWKRMEEYRCSATGSFILTQKGDEQWVSHPRCFTQGETVPVPIQ
jgi:hypothetical protein